MDKPQRSYWNRWAREVGRGWLQMVGGDGWLLSVVVVVIVFFVAGLTPEGATFDTALATLCGLIAFGLVSLSVLIAQAILAPGRLDKAERAKREEAERERDEKERRHQAVLRRENDRTELGRMLAEGNALRSAAWSGLDVSTEDMHVDVYERGHEFREQFDEWSRSVVEYLDAEHPGWSSVFLNESHPLPPMMGHHRAERHRVVIWLIDPKLSNLKSLITQFGSLAQGGAEHDRRA